MNKYSTLSCSDRLHGCGCYIGCTPQKTDNKPQPRPVKTFRIQENTEIIATPFAGEVRARWETTLSFRVKPAPLANAEGEDHA